MNRAAHFLRATIHAAAPLAGLLLLPALAFADDPAPATSSGGGGLGAMSYGLVVITVALGLMLVLRPSGRRDRVKE